MFDGAVSEQQRLFHQDKSGVTAGVIRGVNPDRSFFRDKLDLLGALLENSLEYGLPSFG